MKQVYVLAESGQEFREYRNKNKLNRRHFEYLYNSEHMRGYRGVIIGLGNWWMNPKYRSRSFYENLTMAVSIGDISYVTVNIEQGTPKFERALEMYARQQEG